MSEPVTVEVAGSHTSGGQTSAQRMTARGGLAGAPLLEVDSLVKHFDIRVGCSA